MHLAARSDSCMRTVADASQSWCLLVKVWLLTKPCLHITEYPQIIVGLPAKEGCVRFGISVKEAP